MSSNDNYYQLYLNSVYTLAATIVIKSADTVNGFNDLVSEQFGYVVNTLDPTTWKYYLNVSGEYHPTDTMMTVTSMDTLETINFTKENLQVHLATAKGYQYGTRGYNELVAQFPDQEILILGILYPADINIAIDAPDGTILAYPPNLIEANEYTFITRLQNWIYGYKERWVNAQYNISDPLYPLVHHTIMYTMIPLEILAIRLAACKTNEAHSYHVRMYLASHMGLDQYLDFMTTEQSLWFYRNICYIERNIGQRQIFDLLLEHIMTDRSLPLAQYLMQHDISQMPDQINPTVTFIRTALNFDASPDSNILDLDQLLIKEQPLARDNEAYQADEEPAMLQAFEYSQSSTLQTKLLESAMIDYSNSSPYTLNDILLHHWLWLSSNGTYQAFVSATNPQTGEQIPLSAKDAWTLMWYCWMTSSGIDLSEAVIPQMFAERVQRMPTPPVSDLLSVVDPKYVGPELAKLALFYQPVINPLVSVEAFYNLCVNITTAANAQRNLIALQEHKDRRAMVQNMCERIYSDNVVLTADEGQTYQSWFSQRNLNLSTFTNDQLNLLYLDLVKQATGLALITTQSLASLQQAMVGMFAKLSSYNIQFATEINDSPIRMVDTPVVRVGDINASGSAQIYDPDTGVDVEDVHAHAAALMKLDLNGPMFQEDFIFHGKAKHRLRINVEPRMAPNGFVMNYQVQSGVRAKLATPLQDNSAGVIPVVGIDEWLQLLPDQRYYFMDLWGNDNYYWTPPPSEPLDEAIVNDILNGLTWIDKSPPRMITLADLDGFVKYVNPS